MEGTGIYVIRNIVNNKIYIGSATSFKRRWKLHLYSLTKGKHHSLKLQNAWNKYGKESFSFEVIEYVLNKEDLIKREQVWLDFFKPEYNICKIAGSSLGVKHSDEYKKQCSERMKGRVVSDEQRKKISETLKGRVSPMKGKKHSEETKKQMSDSTKGTVTWNIGRKASEETKKKMSESRKNKKQSLEHVTARIEKATQTRLTKNYTAWNKGIPMTDERRKQMSESKKGRKLSPETIAKRTATQKRNRELKLKNKNND